MIVEFSETMDWAAKAFEGVGVAILIFGGLRALFRYVLDQKARVPDPYGSLRANLGRSILLGLEILVVADIIRTVAVDATIENAVVLGIIVLVRTFLSFSLEVELGGVLPWRRGAPAPASAEPSDPEPPLQAV